MEPLRTPASDSGARPAQAGDPELLYGRWEFLEAETEGVTVATAGNLVLNRDGTFTDFHDFGAIGVGMNALVRRHGTFTVAGDTLTLTFEGDQEKYRYFIARHDQYALTLDGDGLSFLLVREV